MRWSRITSTIALGIICLGARSNQAIHPHAKILGSLIYTDLSVSFDGEEANEIMRQLEEDLNVLLQVYWTTKNLDGCERSAPIFLKLERQPALIVLERIIEQLSDDEEVTWQMRDGVLEVGLKTRFSKSSSHQTITYSIGDLLFIIRDFNNAPEMGTGGGSGGVGGGNSGGIDFGTPGADPESLTKQERINKIIELITTFVEPPQWEQNGGECKITSFNETLIIRAPNFVHRQIGGYPFAAVRPDSAKKRHVTYSNGRTTVRVPGRPSE
jgi:hypothetical protein